MLRLFVALACAALNLRNKQLSILVALSAAIALIAALLRSRNVLLILNTCWSRSEETPNDALLLFLNLN